MDRSLLYACDFGLRELQVLFSLKKKHQSNEDIQLASFGWCSGMQSFITQLFFISVQFFLVLSKGFSWLKLDMNEFKMF